MSSELAPTSNNDTLLADLRGLIQSARERVAAAVNTELTMLYWYVGKRIRTEILKDARAEYGKQIVETVGDVLSVEYGKGFNRRNMFRMVQFAEQFPDEQIVATLWAQLSWSHFRELLLVKDELGRRFYAELCKLERWSVRTLQAKIDEMMYERTAISKKPEDLIARELTELTEEGRMTPDLVFRDPYLLNFLGLPDDFSEADLEGAILREIETFLLEMGSHFTFAARQKRIVIDGDDFVIDLLLYHRLLRRLVVVELKIGKFKAAYKGQTELYLRWLDKYERLPGEEEPIGLILCTEAGPEQVELLALDSGSVRVAEYMTALPPRSLLEAKLAEAVARGQEQIARRRIGGD